MSDLSGSGTACPQSKEPAGDAAAQPSGGGLRWYALYTRSRHEQAVGAELEKLGIERYLPVIARERRWKDRRKKVEFPLFKGYVFARFDLSGEQGWDLRRDVLRIRSVVRILSDSDGNPSPIPDQEIFNIRTVIERKMRVDPYEGEFKPGQTIKIRKGPLSGVEGVLRERKGVRNLVLKVNLLNQAVVVTLSADDVERMD